MKKVISLFTIVALLATSGSLYSYNPEDLERALRGEKNLSGADLSGANLRWAKLSDADLSNANLSGTCLEWANLTGADLSGADLSNAKLRNAELPGADLSGANLSGANLCNAKGLHRSKLAFSNYESALNIPAEIIREERMIAFCMGKHPRLGQESLVRMLTDLELQEIYRHLR